MSSQRSTALGLLMGLALLTVARSAPPVIAQVEVAYLLGFIEDSGCEFYRNGRWYDSKKAQAHLRYKYEHLVASDQIGTAEDFIEKAATQSSFSGRPYAVRCGGGEVMSSNQWLRDALARYRVNSGDDARRAPRLTRSALVDLNRLA